MTMAPRFRRATEQDASALAMLAEKTFRDTYSEFNTPEDMDEHCSKSFGEAIQLAEIKEWARESWLVEIDGKLVAFAQLILDKPCPGRPGSRAIEILRFYVDASQHGTGLAYRFMDELVARATEKDAELVWLAVWQENARATAFYKKCGFQQVATKTFQLGDQIQDDWVMARELR